MKLNYYARLNDSDVCIEIISTPKNLKGVKGYVSIPDYNATLLYKKYDEDTGWSAESYEPEVDTVIQDRLNNLEVENTELSINVTTLNRTINTLEGTINELMSILGGGE